MLSRLIAGVLALALVPAARADDATEWLVKMSEAAKSSNYQGVAIYRGDDMLETFRITHRYQDGAERERVQSLTGEPRDILKQNGKTTCLLPRERRMTVDHPTPKGLFPGLTRERVQQLLQLYEFDELGLQRIAGRICRGIAITPRDRFRYGYEVWADQASAVPLKVNLIGRDGTTLEQMMFTEVDFPASIPDSAFAVEAQETPSPPPPPPPGSRPSNPLPINTTGFDRLPPGFQVIMRDVRMLSNGRGVVEHVILSDGLSAISIFSTRRLAPARVFQGVQQIGAVHAYGRMIGTFHITVVGEAPQETVKMIGDSFKPPAEAPAPGPEK